MTSRAGRALLLLAVLLTGCPSTPASARAVTRTEVQRLARSAAQDDPAALAALRAVDRVDGVPTDVGGALTGAGGPSLRQRLALLARPGPAATDVTATPRAHAILAERRFHALRHRGLFDGAVTAVTRWLEDLLPDASGISVGPPLAAAALGALAIGAVLAGRLIRRGVRAGAIPAASSPPPAVTAAELERLAADADGAGDHAGAVRLRFRAGLLRLGQDGTLGYRASLSSREASRALGSARFDTLARDFDAVAYGDQHAGPEESTRARDGWRELLAEHAGRRP